MLGAIVKRRRRARRVCCNLDADIFALNGYNPIIADGAVVIVHGAGNPGAADLGDPVHRGRGRHHAAQSVRCQHGAFEAIRIFLGDERRGDFSGNKARMVHHRADKRQIVANAFDFEGVKRQPHFFNRSQSGRTPGAEFRNHRIVKHRYFAALIDAGIVAHDAACRRGAFDGRTVAGQPAGRGQKVAIRVFGIEAAFHRPTVDLQIGLGKRQLFTLRHPDHLFDQIDAGDQFGDRMFDLQPGVHLQKVEIARAIDDEFHRPGRLIAYRTGQRTGLFTHRLTGGCIEKRRGRFFDNLLISPLNRAFALVQIDAVSVRVGQHLNFDMARLGHEFLDENPVIAKRRRCLVSGTVKALTRFGVIPGDPHTLAATASTRLDHHRIADPTGNSYRLVRVGDHPHVAGHRGHACGLSDLLRGDLVAHLLNRRRRRADEHHFGQFQSRRKCAVFGQEPIARMDRLGPGGFDRCDDLFDRQIRLRCGRSADMHCLIRHFHVQCAAVGVGIDRHRGDPHLARGLDHTTGNLAPIGDQDFLEHQKIPV